MIDEKEKFILECDSFLKTARDIFDTLVNEKNIFLDEEFLKKNNEMSVALSNLGSVCELFSQVHPNQDIQTAAEKYQEQLSAFISDINLNENLYKRFLKVDEKALDAEAHRYVQKTLQDFRRSGVDKTSEVREQIRKLHIDLTLIGQEFSRNIREDVRSIKLSSVQDLEGLPEDYIASHLPNGEGKIKITTDYPDLVPFMHYAKNSDARKALSFESKNRAFPKNVEVLENLLKKRYELANLLGYDNWAKYVSENKMIKNPENIQKFIDTLFDNTKEQSIKEYHELLTMKKKDFPEATKVEGWESEYYEEKLKNEKFAFDSQLLRPYFEYNHVKNGLMQTISDLFALKFQKKEVSVWHEDVEVYDVFDGVEKLGTIYLDMHPRDNKFKHAAQFTLRNGVKGYQLPEGVLVCNFTDPKVAHGAVALLNHNEVTTFFHEFGHLMHHILSGRHTFERLSGIAVEWDFVEAPSQFLEEWAWDVGVLQKFALHYESQEPIPRELIEKMRAADKFGKALSVKQQNFYSALSLNYYIEDPTLLDTTVLLREVQKKYSMYEYVENTHMQVNFGHIDGYSAIYYTYMWSLVISKDLLSPFLQKGMMDTELALQYRKCILEKGGTEDASEMVQDFLGREYSFDAFKNWLQKKD